jgi:hypothetical protein
MLLTVWDEPSRCRVHHEGKWVRGDGDFIVEPLSDDQSRFTWSEEMIIPAGLLGLAVWPIVRPLFRYLFMVSLRKFKETMQPYPAPSNLS